MDDTRASTTTQIRWALIVGLLIVATVLGTDVARRNGAQIDPAVAIVAGMRDADELETRAEDQDLDDDEAAAGAIWARTHAQGVCPAEPAAFHRGCMGAARP